MPSNKINFFNFKKERENSLLISPSGMNVSDVWKQNKLFYTSNSCFYRIFKNPNVTIKDQSDSPNQNELNFWRNRDMPTIILFDLSLSMCRSVELNDTSESYTFQNLANYGLIELLDYMSTNNKMEYVSLMYFSSLWERNVSFTRDYDSIKLALANSCDTFYDTTKIENALKGVQEYVQEEWGTSIPVQVLLITDGNPGAQAMMQIVNSSQLNQDRIVCYNEERTPCDEPETGFIEFSFPCKLHVINLCVKTDQHMFDEALTYYRRLISETTSQNSQLNPDEQIYFLDSYSLQSVSNLFKNLATKHYMPCISSLHCGSLMSPITIFPPLKSYIESDTVLAKPTIADGLIVYGFLELSEIASPPIHSRHIVLPNVMNREQHLQSFHSILTNNPSSNYELNAATIADLEEASKNLMVNANGDSNGSRQPSLCVLLHGSLKVEGMVAICKVGEPNWFGMLYSWADNKKKSNLMLSTFQHGTESVSWLGNLYNLGLPALDTKVPITEINQFGEKKSYSQSCVVWIKQAGLYSDIQKVLRLAKKLPDKATNFHKELQKFRKQAFTIGFTSILAGMATILERECTLLPNNAHPDAENILRNAVALLKSPTTLETINTPIIPLRKC